MVSCCPWMAPGELRMLNTLCPFVKSIPEVGGFRLFIGWTDRVIVGILVWRGSKSSSLVSLHCWRCDFSRSVISRSTQNPVVWVDSVIKRKWSSHTGRLRRISLRCSRSSLSNPWIRWSRLSIGKGALSKPSAFLLTCNLTLCLNRLCVRC